jgi:hypothetical protein
MGGVEVDDGHRETPDSATSEAPKLDSDLRVASRDG